MTPRRPSPMRAMRGTLVFVLVVMAVVRGAIVLTSSDSDSDAYGHFAAARAMLALPERVTVHWVWLPGWHIVLALLIKLRVGFTGARLFNAALAAVGPVVLYRAIRRHSVLAALSASLAWAVSPLSNLLATSAQSETLFALMLVCASTALARRRGLAAGVALMVACLLRYEAWAALFALALALANEMALGRGKNRRTPWPTVLAVGLGATAILGWCGVRASTDGRWFSFVHDTVGFVGGIPQGKGPLGLFTYTLIVPAKVLGPAFGLVLVGLPRAAKIAPELARASLGILVFLTVTCLLGGSLGLDRHFASIVPFACVAFGFGLVRVSTGWGRIGAVGLVVTLVVHLGWSVAATRSRSAPQRAAAAWVEMNAGDTPIVCTDVALEVLTGLPERKFLRSLPTTGPALIYGWETQLGSLAEKGTPIGRWSQEGGDSVVVRRVTGEREPRGNTPAAPAASSPPSTTN